MRIGKEEQMLFGKYDLEKIVKADHLLRKISAVVLFEEIAATFTELITTVGRNGYGVCVGIKCLFLQFFYDLSDRQMEERLRYDMAFRWFCGFKVEDETPDHTYFCRIRKTLKTEGIAKVFRLINEKAAGKRILRQVFNFVDSSAIKAKETTWDQRDKAIKDGEDALNNDNVDKYSADPDARFGCKGKDKFWYGYKRHIDVDMGSGLIKEIAVTPANVTDQDGLKNICPEGGMVLADKQYCCKKAQRIMKAHGCHSGAIMKNNMLKKNRDKDRWLSGLRAPFEGVFSKFMRRARYRGMAKVQLQAFLEAIVFNLKRLVVIGAPPLFNLPC